MAETGITQAVESCLDPGNTFHGIRTPSVASNSVNSAIHQSNKNATYYSTTTTTTTRF